MDLDINNPAFEERLIAHKVVTTPRGRLLGSEGIGGSPRRPRSLSAPRSRQSQRAADLVNSLYERMGVNYQRGQATDLAASPMTDRTTAVQPFLSRSTTPSNAVSSPNNGLSIFQRPGFDDNTSNNSSNFGEITQSRSFHDRYRVATTRGRAPDRSLTSGTATSASVEDDGRPRSLSRGRVSQRWPPARTEEPVVAPTTPVPTQAKPAYASPNRSASRPSWMESPGAAHNKESSNNSLSRSVEAEEKKEDQAQDVNFGTPVPLKDRISVFGTKKGAASKAARSRPTRSVDPKYAAQFAVRDHPPKIDIYGGSKDPAPSETTDLSTEMSPTTTNEPGKSQLHQPQQQSQQQPQAQAASQASPPIKKTGTVAMAYITAIQSPTKSPKSSSANKSSVPPREIAVSASTDLGLAPNDSQSLAGVSTVSGDEFSNTQGRATTNAAPARRQNWRIGQAPKNQVQSFGNHVASMPPPPLTPPSEDVLERLVEERVKERMAELESKIEERLRELVGAMEERVMARLDCIEQKMVHEI